MTIEELQAQIAQLEAGAEAARTREQFLTAQLSRHLVEAPTAAAVTAAGGYPKLLQGVLMPHLQMVEEGDGDARQFVARVIGADGKPRMTVKDGKAVYMTIADAVAELQTDETYSGAFKATGTSESSGNAKTVSRAAFDTMTPTARMDFATSGGVVVDASDGAAPNGAHGGGNSNNGARGAKTITRAVFDKLEPTQRAAHITAGGQVVD